MAVQINDVVKGAIKVQSIPENACFESFQDLLNSLEKYLSVEIPRSVTNVIIGASAPTEDQTNALWIRFDRSGNYMGNFVFTKGKWVKAYNYGPGEIIWMVGNSNNIPEGFRLVDTSNAALPATTAQYLMGLYLRDPGNTYYVYFAVTYTGI